MKVSKIGDLLGGKPKSEIRCMYTGKTVRKLTADGDGVLVDVMDGSPVVRIPAATPVTHQPWVFDRGNLLFPKAVVPSLASIPGDKLKICGAHDRVVFPDGSEESADPA